MPGCDVRSTAMPLNHYVTLGRSGLRVSPFCLGAMTFGEDWGWGSSVADSEAIIDRFLERGGNFIDTANVYTTGHSEKIIGDYIGRDRRPPRPRRHRHQVLRQPLPRRSQRRRREPQGDHRRLRGVAAPAADRLHRSLLDAHLGQAHAHRGDDARARRPGAGRARSATSASRTRRRGRWRRRRSIAQFRGWTPLVALQIEYSLIERTVEGRADPDGARARAGRDAVVAAAGRRAQRASTRARTRRRRIPTAASG